MILHSMNLDLIESQRGICLVNGTRIVIDPITIPSIICRCCYTRIEQLLLLIIETNAGLDASLVGMKMLSCGPLAETHHKRDGDEKEDGTKDAHDESKVPESLWCLYQYMLHNFTEVNADVLGHGTDEIGSCAGIGARIQAAHIEHGEITPHLVGRNAFRIKEHIIIVQNLPVQFPTDLGQRISINQTAEGCIAANINVGSLLIVKDFDTRGTAKEFLIHAVPVAILLNWRSFADETHGTEPAADIPGAKLSKFAVTLPGILLEGECLQVSHVLEHIFAETLQQIVLEIEELEQIEIGQRHGIYVGDQTVVHVQSAQMWQDGKLIGSQTLERIPIQIQDAQSIVAHEGILVQHLQLIVRQINLDENLEIAKALLVYILDLGFLQINAL